jgi:hypothetical protein
VLLFSFILIQTAPNFTAMENLYPSMISLLCFALMMLALGLTDDPASEDLTNAKWGVSHS